MTQEPHDSTDMPLIEARLDAGALHYYEAESWSMRHGSKDCDHGIFSTLEDAQRFLSRHRIASYGQTIWECRGTKRKIIWENPS